MKISIVASIQFSKEIVTYKKEIEKLGHTVFIPYSSEKIAANELALEEYIKEKEAHGDMKFREEGPDLIKDHYHNILNSDAIVVLNFTKKALQTMLVAIRLWKWDLRMSTTKKYFCSMIFLICHTSMK